MTNRVIAAFISLVLAVGLCPASALAGDGALVAAQSASVSRSAVKSAASTQAKKPSNAVKKKMKAAYLKVLRQARTGSVSCGGKGFGSSYAMFDMGADGYPELFVKTSDSSWGGSFHVYDYQSGKVRYLGVCYLSDGWLYGTSKGVLYCSGGRQGVYYVDRVVKSSGKIAKRRALTSSSTGGIANWLKAKGAKALVTKRITDFSLLNSKIKCTYKMSEAKVSVTASKAYTGKAVKPKVTVKLAGTTLKAGTGYTVSYRNSKGKAVGAPKAVGTYKVIVKGKGNLKGSVTKTFKVVKASASKATKNKRAKAAFKATVKKLAKNSYSLRYRFADLDGDGIVEMIAMQSPSEAMWRYFLIYRDRASSVKPVLSSYEYGDWNSLKIYRKSKSFVQYSAGHGGESYIYYTMSGGKYTKVASRYRYGGSTWSYDIYSGSSSKTASKKTFDSKVSKLLKGTTTTLSGYSGWTSA